MEKVFDILETILRCCVFSGVTILWAGILITTAYIIHTILIWNLPDPTVYKWLLRGELAAIILDVIVFFATLFTGILFNNLEDYM